MKSIFLLHKHAPITLSDAKFTCVFRTKQKRKFQTCWAALDSVPRSPNMHTQGPLLLILSLGKFGTYWFAVHMP